MAVIDFTRHIIMIRKAKSYAKPSLCLWKGKMKQDFQNYFVTNFSRYADLAPKMDKFNYPISLLKLYQNLSEKEDFGKISELANSSLENLLENPKIETQTLLKISRFLVQNSDIIDTHWDAFEQALLNNLWNIEASDLDPLVIEVLKSRNINLDKKRSELADKGEFNFFVNPNEEGSKVEVDFRSDRTAYLKSETLSFVLLPISSKPETIIHHQNLIFNENAKLNRYCFLLSPEDFGKSLDEEFKSNDASLIPEFLKRRKLALSEHDLIIKKEGAPLYIESILNMLAMKSESRIRLVRYTSLDFLEDFAKLNLTELEKMKKMIELEEIIIAYSQLLFHSNIDTLHSCESNCGKAKIWHQNLIRDFSDSAEYSRIFELRWPTEVARILHYAYSFEETETIGVFLPEDRFQKYLDVFLDLMTRDAATIGELISSRAKISPKSEADRIFVAELFPYLDDVEKSRMSEWSAVKSKVDPTKQGRDIRKTCSLNTFIR